QSGRSAKCGQRRGPLLGLGGIGRAHLVWSEIDTMVNVECPGCSAPYNVSEKRIPASGLKMRCPKCGESFVVDKPGGAAGAPAAPREPGGGRAAPRPTRAGGGPMGVPTPPPQKKPLFG